MDGQYYAVPTAVRSLALFWNRKLFRRPGSTLRSRHRPSTSSSTRPEKLTKRDAAGNLLQAGITLDMGGQDHHWLREVLIRQLGGQPYSADCRSVAYNDAGRPPGRQVVRTSQPGTRSASSGS